MMLMMTMMILMMEATSALLILLPGIDHLPCLQEIRSVVDKPFYCQPFDGIVDGALANVQAGYQLTLRVDDLCRFYA